MPDQDVTSRAAYVLLKERYKKLDHDYLLEETTSPIAKRYADQALTRKVFDRNIKEFGVITCEICGKSPLKRKPLGDCDGSHSDDTATVAHKIASSEGGLKYSPSNAIVGCHKCNNGFGSNRTFKLIRR